MPGLWADGWFYISSAGLLVSGALFFFLLGQYRAAADAAEEVHGEDAAAEPVATSPVRPLYIPDEPEPAAPLKAATPAPAPVAAAPAPAAVSAEKKDGLSGATAPGGISPAVVYLQNLKNQLEEMGGELRGLTKKVSAISDRDEALIERLAELTRVVEELKSGAAPVAAVEAPAPKKARKPAEAKPEPAAEPVAPSAPPPLVVAPAPVAAPAATPPTVELKIELGAAPGAGAPVNEPEPEPKPKLSRAAAAAEATLSGGEVKPVVAPEAVPVPAPAPDATLRVDDLKAALEQPAPAAEPAEEKPRRGPVWPV